MPSALWSYEIRRCGRAAVVLPLAAGVAFAAGAATGLAAPGSFGDWAARAGFPLIAGLAAAAGLGREGLLELHLTLVTSYATTLARRLLVLVAGSAAGAIALAAAANDDIVAQVAALTALTTLLLAVAAWAAVTLPSIAAVSAAVTGAWLAELIILDRLLGPLLIRVAVLVALALVLAARVLRAIDDPEQMLQRTVA